MNPVVDELRAALRSFPTGVTVVTACDEGLPYGLTVSAFTSVSLDPPMVLFCVNANSHTHDHLLRAEHVGISILSGEQDDVATVFATPGADKFGSVAWHEGKGGTPLITGATVVLQGRVVQRDSVGSHTVFIVAVDSVEGEGADPLVYYQRRFVHGRTLGEN